MSSASRKPAAPSECPVCGVDVPPGARACPECGADERTGWNDEATRYDGIELPDHAFEDDRASVARPKRSAPTPHRINGIPLHWWLLALLLLAALLTGTLRLL